jgi:uncharacterized protein
MPIVLADIASELVDALSFAFGMFWEILWALILGFAISAAVQAVVSKAEMRRLLPDDSPRSLGIACGLGAASSSSCSYAAVAMARSVFRKGGDFTSAMVFEFAATNLVIELGIVMAILLGWQFTLAEFVGGPLMIVILALLFRRFLTGRLVRQAREQAERGLVGSMEGHAETDMSVRGGTIWQRLRSPKGFTAVSHSFVMDWAAIWKDIFGGASPVRSPPGSQTASGRRSSSRGTRHSRSSGDHSWGRWSPSSPSSARSETSHSPPSSGTPGSASAA